MFVPYVEVLNIVSLNCTLPGNPHGKFSNGKRLSTSSALDSGKRETGLEHAKTEKKAETSGILPQNASIVRINSRIWCSEHTSITDRRCSLEAEVLD